MIQIEVFVLFVFFSISQSKNNLMPNLPVGEYRIVFDKLYQCDSIKNHSVQFNVYFNKKTSSMNEMKGNLTYLVPFDDTLIVDLNFASWGSTGGWKSNSYIFISKNACSNVKNLFGNSWLTVIKAFNLPTDRCPIPLGTYITLGIDMNKFEDNNFPKVYFYGKYKCVIKIKTVEKKVIGCVVLELTLIRPWETPK
ncbi:uncharacterized protein LOC132945569 [Metopolophium dirhodum]|uniref:uncharacterized protein LOC132945569 n=1 Tax=Metopolophium dirhodum TaxID=44670 RepID=UPI00298F8DEB|nr:uncharacterized protein LOC132945569 [Metopolophium dirhodum]